MREGGEKNEGEINKERKIRGRDDGEREEGTMGERKMREEEEGRDEGFECGRTNSGAEKKVRSGRLLPCEGGVRLR